MHKHLQQDYQNIETILSNTTAQALEYFHHQREKSPSLFVGELPPMQVPFEGLGAEKVLELFGREYGPLMANSAGPRYFGFVTGGATPASVAGDWLVSVYDQVMSGSTDSVAHAIERQTIRFLAEMFGLGQEFTGTFVTGATMSNFVSLATARQWVGIQSGVDFSEDGLNHVPVKVVSATPHSSILKSMSMLGIGRKNWIKVGTLQNREAIDIGSLEEELRKLNSASIVVANAGTVNTVDFDNLIAIAELKKKYNFWLHVDAAFGGFAALSPSFHHLVEGVALADTVTIDAHKWMNVPYDSAMQFTRHRDLQVKVFQNNAAYLGAPGSTPDSMHLTPENSRRFRALPAWFAIMAYGVEGLRDIVERNCEAAMKLSALLQSAKGFRVLAPVRMNVVCFTLDQPQLTMDDVQTFLQEVRDDGRVFFTPTLYQGVPAIRAAVCNWLTSGDDIQLGFEVLTKVRSKTFAMPA